MPETHVAQLSAVFHALGDITRREMIQQLAQDECTVTQLAEPFSISLAAASKHIKALEAAGLIKREIRGRRHICRLDPRPLASAHAWLSVYQHFWASRLDVLERLLSSESATQPSPRKSGR